MAADQRGAGKSAAGGRVGKGRQLGKLFELAYVARGKMDSEAINGHLDNLMGVYVPGKTVDADTKGVRIYYYSNEDDTRLWQYTDYEAAFFFPGN